MAGREPDRSERRGRDKEGKNKVTVKDIDELHGKYQEQAHRADRACSWLSF